MVKLSLKQVGEKYRLQTPTGGFLRQMGPRKLSKDHAEYRLAVLNGEEPYDYTNDPVSPEATAAVDAAIDSYIATQNKNIATAQGKIDTANATIAEQEAAIEAAQAVIAEQQAIIDNPESTEEEIAAAQAEIATQNANITAAEKKITTANSTIATQTKNIATYESNIEHADTKVTSVTIEDIPEVLTLEPNNYKMTVKGDFSENDSTLIEANGKLEKETQIQNTGDPANVVIDLGNSNANLAGQWDEVTVKSVAENSLTIAVGAHVNKLIVKRGRVVVKNAYVSDNVDEVVVEGDAVVVANDEIIASKMSDFYNTPAIIHINNLITLSRITTGILTMGHFVYENNARVDFTTSTGTAAGFMIRGGKLLAEFKGEGEWHSALNPVIWLSDFDGTVKIYGGKFFNDANTFECIYAEKGFIEIYGGEFHNVKEEGKKDFLLNCLDANYKAGTAGIKVYGGKFYGFDPAHNEVEGENTNFVAEGYESVYHEDGNYYEVVPVDTPEEGE